VTPEQPVFFYDLGSPECYLVGERVMGELDPVPEWEPVHAAALGIELGGSDRAALAGAAAELGLLPMRWPAQWPADTELAMLTATWAKRGGRAVAYSQAAARQAFAGGRDLGDEGTVLIAAAACEMHPTAVLKGVTLRATAAALAAANQRAQDAGVIVLPTLAVAGELFSGPDCLEQAHAALARS
jgi:2-hydroxychromene-2-carboxylate isomerase